MSISTEQRTELTSALHAATNLSPDQKSALLELLNDKKRYGLVWEEKPEDAQEKMRDQLPVFTEVPERRIEGATAEAPNHVLIEGDNLHALTALQYTHAGKVDVIYIDPPYNTGNKDFTYNDSFVDKEDTWRHSKWLSFMEKRLKLAKTLLKETGVIFISIDDNEQAQLKLLCDEVFGEGNFLNNLIWQKKYSPQNDARYFSDNHDFIMAYKKAEWEIRHLPRTDEQKGRYTNRDNDPRGVWKAGDISVKTYSASSDYPITTPSGRIVNPPAGYCWRYSKEKFEALVTENRIWFGEGGNNVPAIKRFLTDVKEGITPLTIWTYEEVGHNQSAKQEMKEILFDVPEVFSTPKPVKLIDRILRLSTDSAEPFVILDFFAGSGTTLHATMALNAEDGGKRQCILVTNNENDICEKVTYERNKRVIQGYTNAKGVQVPGLTDNTLRYYKTEFVSRERDLRSRQVLMKKSLDLVSLKESCFDVRNDLSGEGYIRLVGKDFFLFFVLDPDAIPDVVEQVQASPKPCKVFVYSPDADPFTSDFEEVSDKVELCALPDAIYRALREALPERTDD